ncbi:MAG: glycosyltransferase family 4 protein, partial [Verrucomicrobiota bacterium]
VVGDPWDTFSPGANSHPLRTFFRSYFTKKLKRVCREATCSLYVTEHTLQRRYPPRSGSYSVGISDVELTQVRESPRTPESFRTDDPQLIFVGNFEYAYKGLDVLIKAMGILKHQGHSMCLKVLGDGNTRQSIEALARTQGVADQVRFLGRVPSGETVNRELDSADVFVLPSRQEGLPRAMVEAMARGLPCLSTKVGGIPELLGEEAMVPPNDASALAEALAKLTSDADRLTAESERNLNRAHDFLANDKAAQRLGFYRTLKEATLA